MTTTLRAMEGSTVNSKIYRANTMSEAVAGLRHDLGPDAVILQTRASRRAGFWGWLGATVVEVQAASAEEVRAARRPSSDDAHQQSLKQSPPSRPTTQEGPPLIETVRPAEHPVNWTPPVTPLDRDATRKMARSMLDRMERQPARVDEVEQPSAPEQVQTIRSELDELRDLVGQVLKRQTMALPTGSVPQGLPEAMVSWYVELISNEVSEVLATKVVESVCQELGGCFDDKDLVRDRVIHHLSTFIPIAKSPLPPMPQHGPLVIALVGPTGVGKTTTAAKIAATCRFHRAARVAMVTCDTYRVAAVQQLQTYADILGMPLHVADRPEVMPQLLASLTDVEIVIIDTPGRSQRDAGRLDELKAFLDAAQPHETHLVLSGTAGEKVLLREAEAFIPLGVDRIVLTKLDEAVSYGMLVDVLHRIGRSLSFVTTGQEVPADIEPASGDRLADMVLRGHDAGRTLRSFRG